MEPVQFCWDIFAVSLVYLVLLKNNHKRTLGNTYRTFLALILLCVQIPHELFLESVKGKKPQFLSFPELGSLLKRQILGMSFLFYALLRALGMDINNINVLVVSLAPCRALLTWRLKPSSWRAASLRTVESIQLQLVVSGGTLCVPILELLSRHSQKKKTQGFGA